MDVLGGTCSQSTRGKAQDLELLLKAAARHALHACHTLLSMASWAQHHVMTTPPHAHRHQHVGGALQAPHALQVAVGAGVQRLGAALTRAANAALLLVMSGEGGQQKIRQLHWST